jgi:deoxyribodipyrimidine photolyase-related protein
VAELRALVVVLGDQLDLEAAAFDGFEPEVDAVWMAEVTEESTHVWSSRPRIVMFLAAMRHFALALQAAARPLHYTRLGAPDNRGSLAAQLQADIERLRPARLIMTAPGDWRVLQAIKAVAQASNLPLDIREDRHFFVSVREFAAHASARKSLRMEYFYREQRKRHRVLMDPQDTDKPLGGQWNFDADNRESFGAAGPGPVPPRCGFEPDAVTREVIALVEERFAQHPGRLESFAWPVTRAQALQSLRAFIQDRLPLFGRYQDAMWPGDPWLYHAHLSSALNLKLLNPREVVVAAVAAHEKRQAPLASVEGFVRQILGWREYVRGIYWTQMPDYLERNTLGAQADLPPWYWTGATDMACLRDAIGQSLTHGYANHIQRLMVTGLYALMLGVQPRQIHAWYLAVYVDAVEWVELPNTLGMSQYADGGLMGSKPYVATGKYIDRMSPHCKGCRYDPAQRTGESACPFTTLYWDFLMRHEAALAKNPRMALQVKNLARMDATQRGHVTARAGAIRRGEVGGHFIHSESNP